MLSEIPGTFWANYATATIAFLGFIINGMLAFGGAQKLAGQREQQRIEDERWKKEHTAQSSVRDIAIAALQAMASSNEATMKGIQGQLALIQTELQGFRSRAARGK